MAEFKTYSQGAANVIILALVILTSVYGILTVYDGDRDAASLDVSLSGVSVKADDMATSFAATGALVGEAAALASYTAIKTAGTTTTGTPVADAQTNFENVLKARIKLQYALKESPLVWQAETGTNGKRAKLHEPENSIDFQFDKLNDGWAGCSTQTTTVFSPFASLSPADVDFAGRCDGDERLHDDDKDSCDDSWMAKLYDPETKPLGITVNDRWSSDTCEYQKNAWPWAAAFVIVSLALQIVYYGYWAMFTSFGTDSEKLVGNGGSLFVLKSLSVLIFVSVFVTIGLFAVSHHKLNNGDYDNGLQDPTTVSFDDDVAIADFPARAQMYHDAFTMCYPEEPNVLPVTGTLTQTNGCLTIANFKTVMDALDLSTASTCAFGDDKVSYETPIDACNLPTTFENYALKADGPQLEIHDKRTADIAGSQTTVPLISIGAETKTNYGLIIAGLALWGLKEFMVILDVFGFTDAFLPCFGGDKYAIAGGYAGAV
jgi:hypothetical protein